MEHGNFVALLEVFVREGLERWLLWLRFWIVSVILLSCVLFSLKWHPCPNNAGPVPVCSAVQYRPGSRVYTDCAPYQQYLQYVRGVPNLVPQYYYSRVVALYLYSPVQYRCYVHIRTKRNVSHPTTVVCYIRRFSYKCSSWESKNRTTKISILIDWFLNRHIKNHHWQTTSWYIGYSNWQTRVIESGRTNPPCGYLSFL